MQTSEAAVANRRGRGARGRKNSDGQEAIIELDAVRDRIEHLVSLHKAHESSASDLSSAIKTVSEKAGIQAAVLRKFVAARAGENFEDKKRDAHQLNLVFEELGG